MKISVLEKLCDETGFSAELLGKRFEMSGMTIRRLLAASPKAAIPVRHNQNILNGVHRLIAEKRLSADSPAAREVFRSVRPASFDAAIAELGISDIGMDSGTYREQVGIVLREIGGSAEHQRAVSHGEAALSRFKALGAEWAQRIKLLWDTVASKKIKASEKLVAFGALFYVVEPFDMVPDGIPVFGLLDDFGMLGYATMHYTKKALQLGRSRSRRKR